MELLEKVTAEEGLPYNPHMVRMILPYGTIMYLGREGETIPPLPGDEPERTYLAYGSSITHGSLGLVPSSTYVFQTAMGLGMDYINQGYPGTAFVERPMAEYLSQRKDWDIATLELGINLIGKPLSDAGFETRVAEFLDVMAADGRPVFVTDIYHFLGSGEEQRRAEAFRDIVRRQALRVGLPHIPGKTLLRESGMISADLTHPTWEGERRIAERWIDVLRRESIGW